MRFPLFVALIAIFAGCAVPQDDTGSVEPEDTDTAAAVKAGPALEAHVQSAECSQGQVIDLDLGTTQPYVYQVEVQYGNGATEPMQASIHMRSSIAVINGALTDYESPIYRTGSTLTFTCGYAWEGTGAGHPVRVDGILTGDAVSYRVTWITAE